MSYSGNIARATGLILVTAFIASCAKPVPGPGETGVSARSAAQSAKDERKSHPSTTLNVGDSRLLLWKISRNGYDFAVLEVDHHSFLNFNDFIPSHAARQIIDTTNCAVPAPFLTSDRPLRSGQVMAIQLTCGPKKT